MNNLIVTILIIIAVVIIILLLLIILMLTNGTKSSSNKKKKRGGAVSSKGGVPMPKIATVALPHAIEKFAKNLLSGIARKIYNSFKVFDYKGMDIYALDKKEWHSWQVSILLMIYKRGEDFFIPEQEKIFHPFLLSSDENEVKALMRTVIKKYENYVDTNMTKDELCRDYRWSNKDISIIFYFLTNYKKYKR